MKPQFDLDGLRAVGVALKLLAETFDRFRRNPVLWSPRTYINKTRKQLAPRSLTRRHILLLLVPLPKAQQLSQRVDIWHRQINSPGQLLVRVFLIKEVFGRLDVVFKITQVLKADLFRLTVEILQRALHFKDDSPFRRYRRWIGLQRQHLLWMRGDPRQLCEFGINPLPLPIS